MPAERRTPHCERRFHFRSDGSFWSKAVPATLRRLVRSINYRPICSLTLRVARFLCPTGVSIARLGKSGCDRMRYLLIERPVAQIIHPSCSRNGVKRRNTLRKNLAFADAEGQHVVEKKFLRFGVAFTSQITVLWWDVFL